MTMIIERDSCVFINGILDWFISVRFYCVFEVCVVFMFILNYFILFPFYFYFAECSQNTNNNN
jgi:riboflavin transporter FmnP